MNWRYKFRIIQRYKIWKRRNRFLCKPITEEEKIQADIRDILLEICPTFIYSNTGLGSVWHKCLCKDNSINKKGFFPANDEEKYKPCFCVWHKTDECHRGKWQKITELLEKSKEQK